MLIVDCIEKVDSVFDKSFKDKSLQEFSLLKGETIPFFYKDNSQLYVLLTKNKFYINTIEELQNNDIRVKVFEFVTIDSLVSKVESLLGWSEKEKLKRLFKFLTNMIN